MRCKMNKDSTAVESNCCIHYSKKVDSDGIEDVKTLKEIKKKEA